jgi:hypothetical protein
MRPLWTDDIPSNVLKLVHKETFLDRPDNPYSEEFVDIVVDITSEKERPTDFPRTVKVGVAEGDTCGPRALTVRTLSTDTMDEAGPLGRPGSASVFPSDRVLQRG